MHLTQDSIINLPLISRERSPQSIWLLFETAFSLVQLHAPGNATCNAYEKLSHFAIVCKWKKKQAGMDIVASVVVATAQILVTKVISWDNMQSQP